MADIEHSTLPAGVSVGRKYSSGTGYVGNEKSLIAASILKQEWIDGLDKWVRQIALAPDGGFFVVGEGKGNRITRQHREQGAVSVKRLRDGNIEVFKYATKAEEEATDQARRDKHRQETEQQIWNAAKKTTEENYPQRWIDGVFHYVDMVEQFADGRQCFTDFPDVTLNQDDKKAVLAALSELKWVLRGTSPAVPRTVVQSNVIALNAATFRRMQH